MHPLVPLLTVHPLQLLVNHLLPPDLMVMQLLPMILLLCLKLLRVQTIKRTKRFEQMRKNFHRRQG